MAYGKPGRFPWLQQNGRCLHWETCAGLPLVCGDCPSEELQMSWRPFPQQIIRPISLCLIHGIELQKVANNLFDVLHAKKLFWEPQLRLF
ncbi:hypothetical protein D3C86_1218280 [compost metagenome]